MYIPNQLLIFVQLLVHVKLWLVVIKNLVVYIGTCNICYAQGNDVCYLLLMMSDWHLCGA